MKLWQYAISAMLILIITACGNEESTATPKNSNISFQNNQTPFNLEAQKTAFKLTQFSVLDINESPYDNGPALAVSFSVPLDLSLNIQNKLTVYDIKNQPIDGSWFVNHARTRAYFEAIEPSTKYQVVVSSKIVSINGQRLSNDRKEKVTTNPLNDSVSFSNKGKILPSKLTRGLPVESVNVKEIDINFHRVYQQQIGKVLNQRLNGYSYYVNQIPQYSELAYSARYSLDYAKNKKRTTILPIHQIKELQKPGLYIAVMKPAGEYPYDHQVTSFYLTNLALQVTQFEKQINLHTLAIDDGQSIPKVNLSVLSHNGDIQVKAISDEKGNFSVSNIDKNSIIIAQHNNDFAVISLASPALDLSEQLSLTRQQQEQELFLYGPRDLYRPGETIHINGLLRNKDGEEIASVPLTAKLLRPDGRVARTFSWFPQQTGFYTRSLSFDKSEPTGEWSLEASHPSGANFQYSFSIEAFLPETMKLDLNSKNSKFEKPNKDINISAQGDYLYGAPAAGNKISAKIKIQPNHFPLNVFKDFYFGLAESTTHRNSNIQEVTLEDKKLNNKGEVSWLLPNQWQQQEFPTQIVFEASLFESGGRPVTRRYRQNVWANKEQIAIRTLFDQSVNNKRKIKISEPFKNASFEIINANQSAELFSLGELEINLIREDTNYYWRRDNNGWGYNSSKKESKVYSRNVNIKEKRSEISLPVDYGNYRLEIKDSNGNLKNSYRFFAGWNWDNDGESSISGARPDKVRIQLDKESYSAGEIAKVTLTTPHLGNALIRVEANNILWEQQKIITQHETIIDIPVSADWKRHDIYVTAMIVSNNHEAKLESNNNQPTQNNNAKLKQLPKRALGILALPLYRNERQFKMTIDAPKIVRPEQTISVKLHKDQFKSVSNANTDKNNKATWVTLAAVDTGVLSLSAYKTPDPFEWFYGQRAYQGNIRDSFAHLIKNKTGKLAVQRFGGDAELSRGGEEPTTDVQIISIFSQLTKFDDNGYATINLELPNFNGELRLMALAFSGNQFSSVEQTMTVRSPLIAELSKPRFLAKGDQSSVVVDLQNLSGKKQTLKATIQFSHAVGSTSKSLNITLNDNDKITKKFPIAGKYIGRGNIQLKISNDDQTLNIDRSWFIDIRPPYPAQMVRHRKVINSGENFQLSPSLVNAYEAQSLQAILSLSTTPPLDSQTHLQGLLQYPYGCLEQTTSRAWPLLNFNINSTELKFDKRSVKVLRNKSKHIQSAIQRINGMQRGNGSFGLWSNQSPENHWLTVYALDFLLQAKTSGYSVPESVISKGIERIKRYVNSVRPSYAERSHYTENAKHYGLAFRAYAAYLLSHSNQVTLSQVRQIDNKLSKLSLSSLPLAHLATAYEKLGDTRSAKNLWNKALNFDEFTSQYSGDYGSLLRDSAWVMKLAAESQLIANNSDLNYQDLIYTINDRLLEKRWFSTQERFSLYRLSESLKNATEQQWSANLSLSGKINPIKNQQSAFRRWLKSEDFHNTSHVELNKGKSLYVDLQLVGYPLEAPKQISDGINVEKQYYNLKGMPIVLNQVKSGEYVLVRIDAASKRKIPDALVVDFIPAGFELENPGLEFSLDYSDIKIEKTSIREWEYSSEIQHREFRDDRFVAAIAIDKNQSSVLFYLMRAVTPGTYQVPATQIEDMYRPYLRALSAANKMVKVIER